MTPRQASLAAATFLIALILLGTAWETFLAPVKPGGSWLVLKVLPLLAALPGVVRGRRHTYKWTTLVIWLYAAEGALRTYTDTGLSAKLAFVESILCAAYFGAAVAFVRLTRRA